MLELGKKKNKAFLPDVIPALKQKAAEGHFVRNLTEVDTKKELAKIAVRAKENQRLSEGVGYKGMQISANLSIDTREELAKIAGALRSF